MKLAVAVVSDFDRSIEVGTLLRVACLGTICDLVPLVGENRTIAAVGLDELGRTRSVGLQELIAKSGCSPAGDGERCRLSHRAPAQCGGQDVAT